MSDHSIQKQVSAKRRLTTVVAADICGYSRLAEANANAAVTTVERVFVVYERVVKQFNGRVFNRAGDGFMAEFSSAVDGVRAAVAFVNDIKARDTLSPNSPAAQVRVGVHVGDVIEQPTGDLLGHGVNIAARLQNEAEANGILISLHAVNLVRNEVDLDFRRRGPMALRHIDEPVVGFDIEEQNRNWRGLSRIITAFRRPTLTFTHLSVFALLVAAISIIEIKTMGDRRDVVSQPKSLSNNPSQLNEEKALRSISRQLFDANIPFEEFLVELQKSGDSIRAAENIYSKYKEQRVALSDDEKLALLHQVGASLYAREPYKALSIYRQILLIEPENIEANTRIGRVYLYHDEFDKSKEHLSRVIDNPSATKKQKLKAADHLGGTFLASGENEEAIKVLKTVIHDAKESGVRDVQSGATIRLAMAFRRIGNPDQARPLLEEILPLQRDLGLVAHETATYQELAEMAEEQGDYVNAKLILQKAIDAQKGTDRVRQKIDILNTLGNLKLKQEDFYQAEADFANAASLAFESGLMSEYSELLGASALAKKETGDKVAACRIFAEAQESYPSTMTASTRLQVISGKLKC